MRFSFKKLGLICVVSALALAAMSCGKSEKKGSVKPTASDAKTLEASSRPADYGRVTLGTYKGISVEVNAVNVTDEEVDSYVDGLIRANPEQKEVDRAARKGDVVNINYVGKKDGIAFDGGTASGYDLKLGSGTFIDGFEDGLIGAKKGDEKDLNLTFPETYGNTELAGQAVVFSVTVNSVKEEKEAVLSDQWVETFTSGAQKTVKDYKEALKAEFTDQREKSERAREMYEAFQAVIDNSTFELSEEAVAYETEQSKKRTEAQIRQYGMDMKRYLEMTNMTEEALHEKLKEDAEKEVKYRLVINEIFEKENFSLEEADYKVLEEQFGMSKEMLIANAGQDMVDLNARYLRVANFLLENAKKDE